MTTSSPVTTSMQMPMEQLRAPIGAVDAAQRTVDVQWLSGSRIKRYDWMRDQHYMLEFSREPGAARMGRLASGTAPVLNAHSQFKVGDQIGVVESATYQAGVGAARLRFSAREEVKPILADVKDKIICNVSAGINIHRMELLPPDAESEGLQIRRAVDFEPAEISLVPVGADAGAVTLAGQQRRTNSCEVISKSATSQGDPMKTEVPAGDVAAEITIDNALEDLGPKAKKYYQHLVEKGTIPPERLNKLVVEADSLKDLYTRVLEQLAAGNVPIRSGSFANAEFYGGGATEANRLSLMSEALAARHGGAAPSEEARQFMGMNLLDMARLVLDQKGVFTRGKGRSETIELAMMSTSDFPELLQGSGNRELRKAYDSYQGGLRRACRKSTAVDFRAKQKLQLGEAPALLKVNEAGEFKYGAMAEAKESYSLSSFGRIVPLSRQAIVNDDLGAFLDLSRRMGRAAAEFESQQLVNLLTSNPLMADGLAVFENTKHKNLASSGTAIDITSLGAAKEAMRLQKGIDGVTPIDVTPKFLIVPAKKETIALQYLTQLQANQASNVNPFGGQLELVTEPRLDAASSTAWYLMADPEQIDTIEYSYLEELQGPQVDMEIGFRIDGVKFRVRLDFGAGVLDWRGMYRNPGA